MIRKPSETRSKSHTQRHREQVLPSTLHLECHTALPINEGRSSSQGIFAPPLYQSNIHKIKNKIITTVNRIRRYQIHVAVTESV